MKIKILSDSTINRIAAGEVIERPASVVKELVENAIDAGATSVSITLEQAGKNLILIADNGFGMSAEDLAIAVERHATSKLDEEDLLNINSFGFRGEALPSIGAISKLTITSRARGSERAYQIQLIGGSDKQLRAAVHNEGTKIEVRDLFFATPARLKFLRTDKTELAAIVEIVKKIAIAHPHIAFNLSHDGRNIINTKAQKAQEQEEVNSILLLKKRVVEIIGEEFVANCSVVQLQRQDISITGLVGLPTFNRASAEDQFLFINNRPVKDKVLNMALRAAYQDYLARDRHPVAVLFINIDPQLVDVNVHPAKSEVRFHDPNLIRGMLVSSIRDALSNSSHKVSNTLATTALGYFKPSINPGAASAISRPIAAPQFPNPKFGEVGKVQNQPLAKKEVQGFSDSNKITSFKPFISTAPLALVEESNQEAAAQTEVRASYPLGAAKTQLYNTYIVSQTEDSIIIIDQHAAHERLGYEKIKQALQDKEVIRQRLLIPEIVELPDAYRAGLLHSQKVTLSRLGLVIESFGERSIIVSEIPSLIGDANIQQLVQDLADHLSSLGENIALLELIEHVTETYACHYSIRAGKKLSVPEMNELLRQMEHTPFSGQCNHGRPTYVELRLKDIEKLFGRS